MSAQEPHHRRGAFQNEIIDAGSVIAIGTKPAEKDDRFFYHAYNKNIPASPCVCLFIMRS
jgi:hypothetical protein